MKLTRMVPQTLMTICYFDDGSSGIYSRQYDSLSGKSVPRECHTLTPDQETAVSAAGEGRKVYTSILGKPSWVKEIVFD